MRLREVWPDVQITVCGDSGFGVPMMYDVSRELKADRLSDHRFMTNSFRLYLHVTALKFMIRLRRATARPEPAPAEVRVYTPEELPAESLDEPQRRTFFNRRRERDVMAEGFASTWRTRLIKVDAEVVVRARRVYRAAVLELATPGRTDPNHRDHFADPCADPTHNSTANLTIST